MSDKIWDRDKGQKENERLLGECYKHLRILLRGLSESAWKAARDAKRQEEEDIIRIEELGLAKQQYPFDVYEYEFDSDWKFDVM